ncbi:MAG: hypothetical protein WAS07_03510 [Micropruina sp.]|nr:hypothetical protein [Micropruina sp.]
MKTHPSAATAHSWVDPAPFRAHVRHLTEATGLSWRAVPAAARLSPALVEHLLFGRAGRPLRRLSHSAAKALFELTPQKLAAGHRRRQPASA